MQFQASGREQARGGTGSGTSIILQYWRSGQEGGGTARLWRRMAAPTGGPKGLPAGVGTWLSAEIAEGGDAGFEGTCNVDWQFQCGVDMRPAALFEVQVYDQNDNGAEAETHVDGFLEAAWNALTAFLKALWEAIKELASAIFDFIWGLIEGLMDVVLQPIIDMIEKFGKSLINKIYDTYISVPGIGRGSTEDSVLRFAAIYDVMITPLLLFSALYTVLFTIEVVVKVATFGVGAALSQAVAPFVEKMVLAALAGVALTGIGISSLISDIENGKDPEESEDDLMALFGFTKNVREVLLAFLAGIVYLESEELPPFAYACLSLIIGQIAGAINGGLIGSFPLLLILDMISLVIGAVGLYKHYHDPLWVPMAFIAAIMYLVEEAALWAAMISTILGIIANAMGKYTQQITNIPYITG